MLKEFAVWLTGRVAGLTIGGNLQVGWRAQDAPVRCHSIVETGGTPNWYLAGKGQGEATVQIISRGKTYHEARSDSWAVYSALNGTAGWQVAALASGGQGYAIDSIEALAFPQYLGPDEKSGFEFVVNYILRMRKA